MSESLGETLHDFLDAIKKAVEVVQRVFMKHG
jgi:hypothetical protein